MGYIKPTVAGVEQFGVLYSGPLNLITVLNYTVNRLEQVITDQICSYAVDLSYIFLPVLLSSAGLCFLFRIGNSETCPLRWLKA